MASYDYTKECNLEEPFMLSLTLKYSNGDLMLLQKMICENMKEKRSSVLVKNYISTPRQRMVPVMSGGKYYSYSRVTGGEVYSAEGKRLGGYYADHWEE
jgi:hypothetical protein